MNQETQIARAERFRQLHDRRQPLLLPNAWDAGSACLFADLGFAAIATTSGGLAWSLGYGDGEQAPLAEVVAATQRIVRATALPVTADFEAGFGTTPEAVAASVRAIIDAGVAGINLEDGVRHVALRDVDDAARRIAAARHAAHQAGVPIVINARVDVWMRPPAAIDAGCFEDAVRRARAYLAAGADCIYPIGLTDRDQIAALVAAIDAPINVGTWPGLPDLAELGRLGVARVSTATRLVTLAYSAARDAARTLRDSGRFEAPATSFGYPDMQRLFTSS
ncbi:MAG: isocitrate lyase/phosphoenolpyruvate mutase family protein [Gammaproteobacteria bacterium]|nr:isocitrate lyase/phosphoenolpyruvate mutase family protein [Gammaproteobacteria bacterium]